jgi:hypothetical protein
VLFRVDMGTPKYDKIYIKRKRIWLNFKNTMLVVIIL